MQIHKLRCFGTIENSGSNAFIIENDGLTIEERLAFTYKQKISAGIFMEERLNDNMIMLDYYYPHSRSPLCIHGTLAAGYVFFSRYPETAQITITTSISVPVIFSVGSPKLLIEVDSLEVLNSITPNLDLINKWGKANLVSGCYVYCKLNDNNYAGRNFNHLDPALEDSATGVAAGALTAYMKRGIKLYQGSLTNNPCLIHTEFINSLISIGGSVAYA